jgi:hypothetical protein
MLQLPRLKKGFLGWKEISNFHPVCRSYGTQVAKTPTPLADVNTFADSTDGGSDSSLGPHAIKKQSQFHH